MSAPAISHPRQSFTESRRRYYVKPAFQARFILQFSLLMVLGCVGFAALIYLYGTQTMTTAFVHSKLRVMRTADFLLPALGLMTLFVASLVAVVAALRLLRFSHKIAGPLFRLERAARQIGGGDLSGPMRLRAGDELQGLADSMGGMAGALRSQIQEIKAQHDRLGRLLLQVKHHPSVPAELVRDLEETQVRLDGAISRFRV